MTLPDLHPDELLWRASRDRITPAERADLGAHLRRCPACALELAVRGEAATAAISSEADHAVAARVVERVLASKVPLKAPLVAGRWPRRLARAAAVALMLTSTAVGASAIAVRLHDRRAAARAREAQNPPPVVAVTPRARRERVSVASASAPPAPAVVPVPAEAPATGRPSLDDHVIRSGARSTPRPVRDAPAETPATLQPRPLAQHGGEPGRRGPGGGPRARRRGPRGATVRRCAPPL